MSNNGTARTQKAKKLRIRQSISTRVTISSIALAMVFGGIIITFSYFMYYNASIRHHQQKVEAIVNSVSGVIDAERLYRSANANITDAYWFELTNSMGAILDISPTIEYLYILLPYNDETWMYFNSAVRMGEPPNVYFRQVEEVGVYGPEPFYAMNERRTVSTGIEYAGEWGTLLGAFAPVIDRQGNVVGIVGADISGEQITSTVRNYIIIASIISFTLSLLLGIILRVRTIRVLKYSFRRILDDGNLLNNSREEFKVRNEDKNSSEITAKLYTSFADNYNGFNTLLVDIEKAVQAHLQGQSSYRIDVCNHEGARCDLVNQINEMLEYYQNGITEVVDIVKSYGEGNFGNEVYDFNGEWVWVSNSLNELRSNFANIASSVKMMADSAAEGNFDVTMDASTFKGQWYEMARRLNKLMKAVELPLEEIEHNVILMSKGDFTLLGDVGLKGRFDVVGKACDIANANIREVIDEISKVLAKIADGDLTVGIHDGYYIGEYAPIRDALKTILKSLNYTMADIQTAADKVNEGAEQISGSSMQLATGATIQNAAIEELSASIELIHTDALQANSSATSANDTTTLSRQFADRGTESVSLMVETMNRVKESSDSVSKIISSIRSIAFQTNLLALNASVEAARAGDHGRGFSVVADEVRTLAGRSQRSAADTEIIIKEDTKIADEGIKATQDVVESFNLIADNITEISELIQNITDISEKQLDSISSINASVSEIAKVVTETTATAEESAAASEELNQQADMLRQKVAFFKIK
ncbi:MAG: methyl-accepting chemotaxis protein [Defluviitaleaceae bacterium]|nr:methyl-accepting chemotaxis protein [Defluviitaleaceae bacterium]